MIPSLSYKVDFYTLRLSKFMSDAIHFLNYGNRSINILYNSDIETHINEMLIMCDFLDSVDRSPFMISIEGIERLEKEMIK